MRLVDLFAQKKDSLIVSRKQKLQNIFLAKKFTEIMIEAVESFLSGQYYKFDPLVGENLCQIRAFMMLDLAKKYQCKVRRFKLKNHLANIKQYFKKISLVQTDFNFKLEHFKNRYCKELDDKEIMQDFFLIMK